LPSLLPQGDIILSKKALAAMVDLRCSQSELQIKAATGEEFGLERRSQVLRR